MGVIAYNIKQVLPGKTPTSSEEYRLSRPPGSPQIAGNPQIDSPSAVPELRSRIRKIGRFVIWLSPDRQRGP